MRVLITGANGFIGRHLINYFKSKNASVVGVCRSGRLAGCDAAFKWQLGEDIPSIALEGVTHAIHLAHDFDGAKGAEKTLKATVSDCLFLKNRGIKRQLFFSSYSAGQHAESLYGITKFKIEKMLTAVDGVIVVRPGLVLGDAGIFGRMACFAKISPLLPLPDGGKGLIPIIDIHKLCEKVYQILLRDTSQDENIFENELVSLRELLLNVAKEKNRKIFVLNVPSRLILYILKVVEYMRLPLPVNADNLRGFMANQKSEHRSTLNS
jgi:uncharacterized protein YbjT (DUF2867 family)